MNATLAPTFNDRALIDTEWGPARREFARSGPDEITLEQRDEALGWAESN